MASVTRSLRLLCIAFSTGFLAGASPCRVVHPVPPKVGEPYHIGTWYFTAWTSANHGTLRQQGERLYGATDTWGGVRDYADGRGKTPILDPITKAPVDFAARRPLIGYYDGGAQETVDAHIRQADSEGIEFFAFYWYLDMATGLERSIAGPVSQFFASTIRHHIGFLLAPIGDGGQSVRLSMTLQIWRSTVIPRILDYMSSPHYFRIAGRPVLVDFQLPFDRPDTRAQAYVELRQAARTLLGVEPLILGLLHGGNSWNDMAFQKAAAKPDGFTCFNFGTTHAGESYAELISDWLPRTLSQVQSATGKIDSTQIYVPCGSMGMDARPWHRIGWDSINSRASSTRPYITDISPNSFRAHLQDIKNFIDSASVYSLNMAILYSWNEWGEGAAVLEPSYKLGYSYADVVREVFSLHPNSDRP